MGRWGIAKRAGYDSEELGVRMQLIHQGFSNSGYMGIVNCKRIDVYRSLYVSYPLVP